MDICPLARSLARSLVACVAITTFACDSDDDELDLVERELVQDGGADDVVAPVWTEEAEEPNAVPLQLVAATFASKTASGELIDSSVVGEVSPAQRERVARPYQFLDEDKIYIEEVWESVDEAGNRASGYRVWERPNATPLEKPVLSGPPVVNDNVLDYVSAASDDELIQLDLKLADFPDWDVPLRPDPGLLSPADYTAKQLEREQAMLDRAALFDVIAAPIVEEVVQAEGTVLARFSKPGWLSVSVPRAAFEALAEREDIVRIDGPFGKEVSPHWDLGDGRRAEYIGADSYLDASYDGGTSNSARHSYGRVAIAINEPGGFEQGACGFMNQAHCTDSRIVYAGRCDDLDFDGNHCEPGYLDTMNDGHGTATSSIALANYRDGQGNGYELGDPAWDSNSCSSSSDCNGEACVGGWCSHSPTWEENATGMAPEAAGVLFGISGGTNGYVDMFDDTVDLGADISSNSWGYGISCDITSSSTLEDMIEVAFDDGVFVVFSAGNNNGDDWTSCRTNTPQDTPKVFSVNAYNSNTSDCENTPATRCLLDRNSCPGGNGCSARGGATATVAGSGSVSDAVRVIDAVAPNGISFVTGDTIGGYGTVSVGGNAVGTSMAAPHVSGLAALVKDYLLSKGSGWINYPGRLHTMMLLMTDRHFSDDPSDGSEWTHQLAVTPDYHYGLGRVKMRRPDDSSLAPFNFWMVTASFTSSGTYTFYPFGTDDLPSGIEMVKCVTMQDEDMSHKSDISDMRLEVRLRPNATSSSCSGTPVKTTISDNYDTKKVVAMSNTTFTNRCIEVTVEAEAVTSSGITTHTVCYYSGVMDDEEP